MDIALALGGGGVKGHAHVGVLRAFEREGIRIKAIAGTSAGGLWGGLYAAGYSPDVILEKMGTLDPDTIYERVPDDGPAVLGLAGIRKILKEMLGDLTFEDLKIPFGVTAVNLNTAELVVIQSGKIYDAILATIAIPGIFPPVIMDGKTLVDGGLLDPVPVRLARWYAYELPVVAVVLSPSLDGWSNSESPRLFESLPFVAKYIARLRIAQAFNIFVRTVDIAGVMMTEMRLQNDRPEVIIRPSLPQVSLLDEVDANELAKMGDISTQAALSEIKSAMRWDRRLKRRLARPFKDSHYIDVKSDA